MRFISLCLAVLALTGCALTDSENKKSVDLATLGPLTGREQALIYGADGAFQQGNYAAAERDYMTAAAASTGHVEAHLALARLYEKQHQPEKETAILKQALVLQPNHAALNYRLGKLQLNANQYADALTTFRQGRLNNPQDVDLAVGEAVANDMMGAHGAAQIIYRRIMSDNPKANLANVRTNLGMSYLLGGEPKKALEVLKVDAKKPGATQVSRHNLALAYGMLGRHGDAKAILKGDMDEETRLLTIARMKEYVQQREQSVRDALKPAITPAEAMAPASKK